MMGHHAYFLGGKANNVPSKKLQNGCQQRSNEIQVQSYGKENKKRQLQLSKGLKEDKKSQNKAAFLHQLSNDVCLSEISLFNIKLRFSHAVWLFISFICTSHCI